MSPIEIDEHSGAIGPCVETSGRRASSKGFLAVSMASYLELLDWTGRQIHVDKAGVIPEHLAPILSRIGLDSQTWCDVVKKFGRMFKRAAGASESLAQVARRRGQRWLCAPANTMPANTMTANFNNAVGSTRFILAVASSRKNWLAPALSSSTAACSRKHPADSVRM